MSNIRNEQILEYFSALVGFFGKKGGYRVYPHKCKLTVGIWIVLQ